MKQFIILVGNLSRLLDRLAAVCIVVMMALVVLNILLRTLFSRPLLGTIDYVNILMAVTISLGLAFCGLKNAHIAVEFMVEKLPVKIQAVISVFINLLALIFWSATAWYMAAYARNMMITNLMAGTVSIFMYPVVYMAAIGILALCLVLVLKLSDSVRMVIK